MHDSAVGVGPAAEVRGVLSLTLATLLLMCCATNVSIAQESAAQTGFLQRTFEDDAGPHKYSVFLPADYSPERQWPVILYLHSAGERGDDGRKPLQTGLAPIIKRRADTFPFVAVFPQCEDTRGPILEAWNPDAPDGARALKILDQVIADYSIDSDRQILTGWSMGGYGTWKIAAAMPDRWVGIVPVSGGGNADSAAKLKDLPIWAFHGQADAVVPVDESREMVEAVRSAGGQPRYTEVTGVGHDVWPIVYSSRELEDWMRKPVQGGSAELALRARPGERPAVSADDSAPFEPAARIPGALYARFGNDMLKALAYSVPSQVPENLLRGRIGDIYSSTVASGRTFQVRFSSISYAGQITRAHLEAYRKDRLNIQLGIQNARLTIGATYVTGRNHSATAGAINVVIGHRRPVWLSLAVEPYVENDRLRLRHVATRFQIPSDNWYVTSPGYVSTQGFGMTEERVRSGLVSGLYGSRGRIEAEVRNLVPDMIPRLEENLEFQEPSDVATRFWPLPVYRPRLRLWPQAVSTDEQGVSLVFGATAAAIDPQNAPAQAEQFSPAGTDLSDVPGREELQVGISSDLLTPLTQMLIEADVARVHVTDIPDETFTPFADRTALQRIIPDIANLGDDVEIWSELVMVQPLEVKTPEPGTPETQTGNKDQAVEEEAASTGDAPDAAQAETEDQTQDTGAAERQDAVDSEPSDASQPFEFDVPGLVISLAYRQAGQEQWTPYAEFEFDVRQQAVAELAEPSQTRRALRLQWVGQPQVQARGRFASEYTPENPQINTGELASLFEQCWTAWTSGGPATQAEVDDVDFGVSKLRLNDLGWQDPFLYARFTPPGIRISNEADEPLVYQTRGLSGNWSQSYTLEPGKSHQFDISYPLTYRREVDGRYRMYTLPVGSHSEFREPSAGGPPQLFKAKGS